MTNFDRRTVIGLVLITATGVAVAVLTAIQTSRQTAGREQVRHELQSVLEAERTGEERRGDVGLSPGERERTPIREFVRKFGDKAIPALLAVAATGVHSQDAARREDARISIDALGSSRDSSVIPQLMGLANDPGISPEFRLRAREALRSIPGSDLKKIALEALKRSVSWEDTDWAVRQMLATGGREMLPALREAAAREPAEWMRAEIRYIIAAIESPTKCVLAGTQKQLGGVGCTYYCVGESRALSRYSNDTCPASPSR